MKRTFSEGILKDFNESPIIYNPDTSINSKENEIGWQNSSPVLKNCNIKPCFINFEEFKFETTAHNSNNYNKSPLLSINKKLSNKKFRRFQSIPETKFKYDDLDLMKKIIDLNKNKDDDNSINNKSLVEDNLNNSPFEPVVYLATKTTDTTVSNFDELDGISIDDLFNQIHTNNSESTKDINISIDDDSFFLKELDNIIEISSNSENLNKFSLDNTKYSSKISNYPKHSSPCTINNINTKL